MLECGVPGSRAQLTDGAWGGWGMEGRGRLPRQEDEELVALSGKATAGDASGAGEEHVGPALALGLFWHLALSTPKPSESRCPAAYSQRVWAGARRGTVC